VSTCLQVYVALSVGASGPLGPPAIVPLSQCSSVKFENVSEVLPVLVTTISYRTFWPPSPVSGEVVNEPLEPSIFCSFSIVNAGEDGTTFTTTMLEVWVIGEPSPGGGVAVIVPSFSYVLGLARTWVHVYVVLPPREGIAPGSSGVSPWPPEIVPESQCSSMKLLSTSGTLPVF